MIEEQRLASWLEDVIDIAREAGERILEVYEADFAVEHKDDRSPLTEADLASHRVITRRLDALSPRLPVLSEENARIPFAERARWEAYWLVDPLDGTKEFVKRNGEFTVNIALIERGRPALGVVLVPVTGVCYYAARGLGARKIAEDGADAAIRVRPFSARNVTVAGSRSHGNERTRAFMEKLGAARILEIGSSLKICLVAEGEADAYPRFGPTSEWDTAAAQCVVERAGGQLVDLELRALRYNTKESLLNPHFLVIGDPGHDWSRYLEGG